MDTVTNPVAEQEAYEARVAAYEEETARKEALRAQAVEARAEVDRLQQAYEQEQDPARRRELLTQLREARAKADNLEIGAFTYTPAANIIDCGVYKRGATYTGPGNLDGNVIKDLETREVSGYFTGAGAAVDILVGFHPMEVTILNETGGFLWTKMYGMAAANSIKLTLGTIAGAVDTTSAILIQRPDNAVQAGGANPLLGGVWVVTLSAALCVSGANIIFEIDG